MRCASSTPRWLVLLRCLEPEGVRCEYVNACRARHGSDAFYLQLQMRKMGSVPISGGELLQDVARGGRALLPGRELGLDAQLLRAGEACVATLFADEVDDLPAVERRILDELQLHRL